MNDLICVPIVKFIKEPHNDSELVEALEEIVIFYLVKTFYNYVAYFK